MEPYAVPLPGGVTLADLDREFAVERVVGDDSNPFTIRSRETLLQGPPGGPYTVSLYRHVTDRYHRRPRVTLTPSQDGQSLNVAWADTTERQFWMATTAAGVVFAIAAIVFSISISLLGLVFVLPAAMLMSGAHKTYRSSPTVQHKDCEDALEAVLGRLP